MLNKKVKKTDLSIAVILWIGILIAVNFLSYQIFHRWDLTENRVYSISEASKKTVRELDDVVNVKAYFSASLPAQLATLRQEVSDILDEYRNYSNGKLRVEFIDPSDDMEQELYMLGIPQLTFQVYEKDKAQLVNGYMGIAVSHGDKTEVIPAVKQDTSDLEYQITTAIKKVITDKIATIGVVSAAGSLGQDKGALSAAWQELGGLYGVRAVELAEEGASIPADIDTVIIAGPKEKFAENQLKAIDAFLARGGSALILADGVRVEQGLQAVKNPTGLEGLLAKYGITLNQDLVADVRSGMASFSQGFFTFSASYPFWPQITGDYFNHDYSAVAGLENVILPWASSLTVDEAKIGAGNFSYLFSSTEQAWRIEDNFNIAPQGGSLVPQGERKRYDLAVAVKGGLKRAYAGEDGASPEGADMGGKLVVVSDSDFATDGFVGSSADNLTLFLNLVDSLSLDDDLINIRSKSVVSRPFKEELADAKKSAIRYGNVLGVTILVVLFGLLRYFMRRRSRFVDEL